MENHENKPWRKPVSGEKIEICSVCAEGLATQKEENGLFFWECDCCGFQYVDAIQHDMNKIQREKLNGIENETSNRRFKEV